MEYYHPIKSHDLPGTPILRCFASLCMTDVDVEVVKRADRVVRPYGRKTKCRRPKDAPTIEQEGILVHCVVCPPGVPQDDRFKQYKTEELMQIRRTESPFKYDRMFPPFRPCGTPPLKWRQSHKHHCCLIIRWADRVACPTIEQEEILVHCVVCPPGVPQDDRFQQYKTEEWMQRGRTESSLQYYRYVFHPSVPAGHLPSSGGNPTNTIIA